MPLLVEVLESDFLDHGCTEAMNNGNVIVQASRIRRLCRRVAYWLFDQHPATTACWRGSVVPKAHEALEC